MKRKGLRRISSLCLCALVLGVSGGASAAKGDWYQVKELRDMTKDGWHQTYETKWRTVRVDVDIEVPDVEAFPVVKVRRAPVRDELAVKEYSGYQFNNAPGNFDGWIGQSPQGSIEDWSNVDIKSMQRFGTAEPDCLPEDNPLTYQEACAIADQALRKLYGFGIDSLVLKDSAVISRLYQYRPVGGERVWVRLVNDLGYYEITFEQTFYDISIEWCHNYQDAWSRVTPRGLVGFDVVDADNYYVGASLFEETSVVHQDAPILPLEKAKTALESEIEKGLLREVVEMKLCYAPYYDPADQEAFYLLPVWYARGVYANSADKKFTSFTDSGGVEHMDTREYQELVFEAQKGGLMNWDESSRSRRDVPKIITWSQVR